MTMVMERDLPTTSRIGDHGEYNLLGYKGVDYGYNLPAFRHIATVMFRETFQIEPVDALQEVAFNMNNGGSIVIATLRNEGEAVAYSTQRLLRPRDSGVRVLYISTRLVQPDHQKGGLGTALLRFAHNLHDAPDIVGGRTQNPAIVTSYYKSELFRKIYPFDDTYDKSESMQKVLEYVVSQTKDKNLPDLTTGLVEAVYKEGASKAYDDEKANPEVQKIYQRMTKEFGLKPENGDAIYILGIKKGWTNFVE